MTAADAPERLQVQVWPGHETVAYVRADLVPVPEGPEDARRAKKAERRRWKREQGVQGNGSGFFF